MAALPRGEWSWLRGEVGFCGGWGMASGFALLGGLDKERHANSAHKQRLESGVLQVGWRWRWGWWGVRRCWDVGADSMEAGAVGPATAAMCAVLVLAPTRQPVAESHGDAEWALGGDWMRRGWQSYGARWRSEAVGWQ